MTTPIYTLSLHDALPILANERAKWAEPHLLQINQSKGGDLLTKMRLQLIRGSADEEIGDEAGLAQITYLRRSEEHTSELQSRGPLVCRPPLEKKKRH